VDIAYTRHVLAGRLQKEMARKDLSPELVAEGAALAIEVVRGYLGGTRPIRFEELTPLCRAMAADAMWLISSVYRKPSLNYRNTSSESRRQGARVENAFLLIQRDLPAAVRPRCTAPRLDDGAANALLAETNAAVGCLRSNHPTVEDLYDAHHLPVLALHAGEDGFDAFLLNNGDRFLACINQDKPTARLEVSLLHEFAHFAFDVGVDIPMDEQPILPAEYYRDDIPKHARREYVATKFAQLWLVPYAEAERIARPNEPDAGHYVQERRVSPDVVANAIWDVRRAKGQRPSYTAIRERIAVNAGTWSGRPGVRDWLLKRTAHLHAALMRPLEEAFGESRRAQVKDALGMGNG